MFSSPGLANHAWQGQGGYRWLLISGLLRCWAGLRPAPQGLLFSLGMGLQQVLGSEPESEC